MRARGNKQIDGFGEARNRKAGQVGAWLPKNKVKFFKELFDRIRVHIGKYDGARDFIGLNASSLDELEKGKVSALNARRILTAYNKIKDV